MLGATGGQTVPRQVSLQPPELVGQPARTRRSHHPPEEQIPAQGQPRGEVRDNAEIDVFCYSLYIIVVGSFKCAVQNGNF